MMYHMFCKNAIEFSLADARPSRYPQMSDRGDINVALRKALREAEAGLIETAIMDERLMELDYGTDDESDA